MKHLKLFFALFAMLALGVGNAWGEEATITFSEKGLENGVQYSDPFEIDGNTTIVFAGGGNDGKYYDTGSGMRTYGEGTITIACANGTFSEISFTWSGTNNTYKPTDDVATPAGYSTSTGKWTGSASSVTLTRPSGNGHWRLQKVTVTYETTGGSDTPEPDPDPTPDPEPGTGGEDTWTLVTNASNLKVGDQIVIAALGYNYAMAAQNGNYRNPIAITKDGNNITINSDVQILTLEAGTKSSTYAFNTGSGYLYACSSSSNYLKTQTTNNDNGSWTITIINTGEATLIAQGEYTRNMMQYNANSGTERFSCYATDKPQKPIAIYKKVTSSGGGEPETPATELTNDQFAWSAATAEATMGASNTFPTLTNTLPISVTYESSTTATATIDATSGAITLVAPGTTTISAKFAGGEVSGTTYAPKTVTYALTVHKAPATPTENVYVKVTETAGITDGEYLIVYEDAEGNPKAPVAFDGSLAPVKLDVASNNVEVSIASNTIAGNTDIDAATFTIYTAAGTIQTKDGYYIGQTSNANGLATSTTTEYTNTISIENDGSATIISSGGAYLRYNSDANNWRFRYYKSSSYSGQKAIALYKKASKHMVTIADCTNGSVNAKMGETSLVTNDQVLSGTQITLGNEAATGYKLTAYDVYKTGDATTKVTVNDGKFIMPEFDVTISATFEAAKTLNSIEITTPATQTTFWQGETFNYTDLEVTAHFDGAADEVVTPTVTGSTAAAGTQTVTVSYTEGTTTKTATYTITVKAIPNTKETAYSVADAYDIIDKLTTAEGVFISGIVSEIVTAYNSQYGNISYNISVDGLTTSKQLQAYRGKSYNGDNFTAADDIKVGDKVIVKGTLKKYNTIYEFDANNQLVELTRNQQQSGLAYGTTEYSTTLGESFETPTLTNPNDLTVTYSSDNTSAVEVNEETGEVTIKAVGKAKITATFAGNLTYAPGSASYTITVTGVATLPFAFDGKQADIEGTTGMSHDGIDATDYKESPYLKMNTTGDWLVIRFDSQADELSYDIKGNPSQGTFSCAFAVQESEDGSTYTDLVTYTTLETTTTNKTHKLAPASRYVKFVFTEKSNGNVALGNISITKPDLRAEAGIAWNPATVSLTVGDAFTAPTFNNPNGLSGITFASSNDELATVNNAGEITLESGKTGTATITAKFDGNSNYKDAKVSCTITVNPKTETVVILAQYNGQWYALKNVEQTAGKVLAALPVNYVGGKLYNVDEVDKETIEWQRAAVTDGIIFKNGDNYISGTSGSTDLKLSTTECAWTLDGTTYKLGNRTFIYRAQANGFKNYNATTTPGTDDYSELPVVTAPVYVTSTPALTGKFSTGKYEYAQFAPGNLQYNVGSSTWAFAENQYDCVGEANINVGDPTFTGTIDMFGWSTNKTNYGVDPRNENEFYDGEFVDWGNLFPVEDNWSTLSADQWKYLLNTRPNASSLKQIAKVDDMLGIMLFPDKWTLPAGCEPVNTLNHDPEDGGNTKYDFYSQNYTLAQWTELEKAGAVFLPAAGRRTGGWGNETISPHMQGILGLDSDGHYKYHDNTNYHAYYWTSTYRESDKTATYLHNIKFFGNNDATVGHASLANEQGRYGQSVRLAKVTSTLVEIGGGDNSKVLTDNNGLAVNVKVNRTFKANDGYYTICLPFDLAAEKIGKAYQIQTITEHVAGEGINVEFTEVNTLTAGQPYLLLPSKNLENPIFEGVTIVNTTGVTTDPVVGAGIKITFTGIINGVEEYTNGSTDYYVGDNGYLYNGTTEKLGLRAFFTITDEAGNPTKVRARVVVGENTTTDLENILNGENTTIKVIENGQLIIIRNGEKFNAQGVRF